jgi:hypothetical protein
LHTVVGSGYALGWGVEPNLQGLNAAAFVHGGSNQRWFALMWFSPSADAGALVVTNGGGERGNAAVNSLDLLLRQRIVATP